MDRIDTVAKALSIFLQPASVAELRGLNFVGGPRAKTAFISGNDLTAAASLALQWEADGARGVYFTPNPVRPDLLGSRANAKKGDIAARMWLLIDVDPVRPVDASSTEAERAEAWSVLGSLRGTLEENEQGLVGAVVGDSGNGFHLCYPVLLPNNDASQELVKNLLKALAAQCDTEGAKVDAKTFDAVRIWKLYGTAARKGEATQERPHRLTQLVEGGPWNLANAEINSDRLTKCLDRLNYVVNARRGRPETSQATYAAAALKLEVDAVAGCTAGRNNRLNEAGMKLGQFVGAGVLERTAVEAELYQAACRSGLDTDSNCGMEGIRRTIRSGLEAGIKKPRDLSGVATNGHANGANGTTKAQPEQEAWRPPIPLNAPPRADPFPNVFPVAIQKYVQECAWATNSPIDFTAVALLATAAGAIGNSRRLAITRTHYQPACIFAAIVGLPGSGKSRPVEMIKEPLEHAEHLFHDDWKEQLSRWEDTDLSARGPKPILRRCLLDDTTTEAMVRVMSDNPRGLVMVRDELSALVTGLNQYKDGGKGNDRQTYLKIWSGSTIKVDRKSLEGIPLSVRRPLVCIIGGIQPQVIEILRGESKGDKQPADDGFLDRFLVSYPETMPAIGEQWREVTQDVEENWAAIVQTLLDLQMDQRESIPVPKLVYLTPCGRTAWARLTQEHADQVNSLDFPDWLRGPWSKLVPGYAGRLALVLHTLRWACSEVPTENVDGHSVELAFELINYFKSHARRLYAVMGADPRVREAKLILTWLERKDSIPDAFSRRDIYVDLKHSFSTPEAIDRPLRLLTECAYLRHLPEAARSIGRRPAPKFELNPLWKRHVIH